MKKLTLILTVILLLSGVSLITSAQQNKKKHAPAPKNARMIKDKAKDTVAANHKTKLPPPKTR